MQRVLVLCLLLTLMLPVQPIGADAPKACSTITLDQPQSDACAVAIAANPAPDLVRPVTVNPKKDGVSHPRSVLIPKEGLPYPLGWIVRDWYYSDRPGVIPPAYSKDRLYRRAALVYVYATVEVKGKAWHLIGPDRWLAGEYISVLAIPRRPEGVSGHWIALDLAEQTLVALHDDTPIFATLVSAAYNGYGYTREGLFHIYARTRETIFRGPPWEKVPKYVLNHVPDVMFFDGNIALNGAYWHDWFGLPRTHGSVNVPVGDQAWLWDWVSETAKAWGPDAGKFFIPHPEKAPFVYVYKSKKFADNQ